MGKTRLPYVAVIGAIAGSALMAAALEIEAHGGAWGKLLAVALGAALCSVLMAACAHWYEKSTMDDMTRLYNRRYLFRRLAREFAFARRTTSALAIAVIDVDDFKSFNTRFGHLADDEVLSAVARTIQANVRAGDTVGRWGGEEFAIILPGADAAAASEIAHRVCARVGQLRLNLGQAEEYVGVTVSIGVVVDSGYYASLKDFLHHADATMYQAKRRKNATVVVI